MWEELMHVEELRQAEVTDESGCNFRENMEWSRWLGEGRGLKHKNLMCDIRGNYGVGRKHEGIEWCPEKRLVIIERMTTRKWNARGRMSDHQVVKAASGLIWKTYIFMDKLEMVLKCMLLPQCQ